MKTTTRSANFVPRTLFVFAMMTMPPSCVQAVKRHVQVHRGVSGEIVEPWKGQSVQDLHREYGNIFKHGNRNAASHLWSSFLLDRAPFITPNRLQKLSAGYCAVSGSPVSPSAPTRYRMKLDRVDGSGKQMGFMYYCCWPCVCDTQDFIRIDTKTITTADGPKEYNFAVVGNPCMKPWELKKSFVQPFDRRSTTIMQSAPEVRCGPGGKLEGAAMSDNNYVIISMFFDASKRTDGFQDEADFAEMCEDRKQHGYNSGMGEIFRHVAAINPVEIRAALAPPLGEMGAKQLRAEAYRLGLDLRGIVDKAELLALVKQALLDALWQKGAKELRAEAVRRGIDVRGIADKQDMIGLLATSLGGGRHDGSSTDGEEDEVAQLDALWQKGAKELRAKAVRRGIDIRGIADKQDLIRLLAVSLSAGRNNGSPMDGEEDEVSAAAAAASTEPESEIVDAINIESMEDQGSECVSGLDSCRPSLDE